MAIDYNLESYANQSNFTVSGPRIIDGSAGVWGSLPDGTQTLQRVSDSLKFSNCKDWVAENLTIIGGKEDAIDINRGANGTIRNCVLDSRGLFLITVKGGFQNLLIKDCQVVSSGSETGIDIGNYSQQGKWAKTGLVTIDGLRANGTIEVRVLWGKMPIVLNSPNVKVRDMRIAGFFYTAFRVAQDWVVAKFTK
jgi:hypothetical protein